MVFLKTTNGSYKYNEYLLLGFSVHRDGQTYVADCGCLAASPLVIGRSVFGTATKEGTVKTWSICFRKSIKSYLHRLPSQSLSLEHDLIIALYTR